MKASGQVQRLKEELRRTASQRDLFAEALGKTLERFEEKVRELSVIRRIGESLKYTLDIRKVFEVILDAIIGDTNAENCSLMLLNRETGELKVKAARGQKELAGSYYHTPNRTGRTFRLGEGIAGWVAQHGEPLYIPNISSGEIVRFYPELDENGKPVFLSDLPNPRFIRDANSPIGSLLCLPLITDKQVVGVVNLSHPHTDAFSPMDQRLMTIITDQVAIALNNVQVFDDMQHLNRVLEEEVDRATEGLRRTNLDLQAEVHERERAEEALRVRTQELAAVTEAAMIFLEKGDWRGASDTLLAGALRLTESALGFVGVVVEGRTLRLFPYAHKAPAPGDASPGRGADHVDLDRFDNLFGMVIVSGKALVCNDPAEAARCGGLPPDHPVLGHFLGIPILREGEAIGMIGVANRPGGYTLTEQDRLEVLSRAAGVLYDSYRRKEHEAALERQLFQAQKMEAIGTLAGGIAHDFNNLLTNIIGFSELALLEPDGSPRWRGYVSKLPQQGQRAARLISQLMNFSRPGAAERQPLQMSHLVRETVKMLRRTLPEHVLIQTSMSGEVARVNADPTQMQQVMLNLCINASHAMPHGGELTVGLRNVTLDGAFFEQGEEVLPGNYVCLSVRDTGTGMTPEVRKRIFEPFFTTKGAGQGTGLGLAMVHGVLQAHKGHIRVTTEVGRGSEFNVYFPAIATEVSLPASSEESPEGGKETVLLVEDQEEVLSLGREMLERLGYRVLPAANGKDALAVYRDRQREIDLVLTDAVMPVMGGEALCEALRQVNPEVRALIMSGYSSTHDLAAFRERGVRGFVQKPFSLLALGRAVRQALGDQVSV